MRYIFTTTDEDEADLLYNARRLNSKIEKFQDLRSKIYKYDALHHEFDFVKFTKWSHDNKSYLDSNELVNAYHYAVSVIEDDILNRLDEILNETIYA